MGIEDGFGLTDEPMPAEIEPDQDCRCCALRTFEKPVRMIDGQRQGLFHKEMFACIDSGYRQSRMIAGRDTYGHGIDLGMFDQHRRFGESMSDVPTASEIFNTFVVHIRDGDDIVLRDPSQGREMQVRRSPPASDDPEAEFVV
jgi:hypothetical protein